MTEIQEWRDRCMRQATEIANLTAQVISVSGQYDDLVIQLAEREKLYKMSAQGLKRRDETIDRLRAEVKLLKQQVESMAKQKTCGKCLEPFQPKPGERVLICYACRGTAQGRADAIKCATCKHGAFSQDAEYKYYCEAGKWRSCDPLNKAAHYQAGPDK